MIAADTVNNTRAFTIIRLAEQHGYAVEPRELTYSAGLAKMWRIGGKHGANVMNIYDEGNNAVTVMTDLPSIGWDQVTQKYAKSLLEEEAL